MFVLQKKKLGLSMASSPQNKWGDLMKHSEFFCDHVNFPEMNGGISVNGGTKSNNHKEGG